MRPDKRPSICRLTISALPVIILLLFLAPLCGCSMGALYGDLDGQWQIMQVTDAEGKDMEMSTRYYYAFERNVVQLRKYPGQGYFTGNLHFENEVLTMDFPYIEPEEEEDTIAEWWILSNPCTMHVLKIDSKNLVMQSGEYTITCRKF